MEELDRAFLEGAVLLDRTGSEAVLEVRGDDASDYLQRMLSCDLRKLTGDPDRGQGSLGVLMTGKGRLIAPFMVHRMTETGRDGESENCASFWFLLESSVLDGFEAALERLVILEDVSFFRPKVAILSVQGPGADAALLGESVGGEPLPGKEGERVRLELGGGAHAWVVNRPRCLFGGWDFVVPIDLRDSLAAGILERGAIECADESAVERHRILAAIPRFGVDGTEANLPPEAGYDAGIAYDKGCYAGQEVVARIRTYGHVNRRLCALNLLGSSVPPVAAKIRTLPVEGEEEGKVVGEITSATLDPRSGCAVALGFVRYKKAVLDQPLEIVGVGRATITAVIGTPTEKTNSTEA